MKFKIIMSIIAVIIIGFFVLLYEASITSSTPVHKGSTTSSPSKTEDAMKGLKF